MATMDSEMHGEWRSRGRGVRCHRGALTLRLLVVAAWAQASWPGVAQAGAGRVVVVSLRGSFSDEAWPDAERRLEAELAAMGFDVSTAEARAGLERSVDLDRAASEAEAVAALSIARLVADGSLELWVADRVTGKSSLRRLLPEQLRGAGANAAATAALRAVELLHASLIELRLPHAARGSVEPSPALEELAAASSPERAAGVGLGMGVLALHLSPKLGTLAGPSLTASWRASRELELALELFGSVMGQTIRRADLAASIDALGGLARASWSPWPDAALVPWLGVQAGLLALVAEGRAPSPLVSRRDTALSALLGASAGATFALTPSLRLAGEVGAEAALPRSRVRFGELGVGRLGAVLWEGRVGLHVDL